MFLRLTTAPLAFACVALLTLLGLLPLRVAAQAYPALHITALAQRSDRSSVAPNGTFHVTIHVRIAQRRDRLDELILGTFTNCEIISNETVRNVVSDGTDFIERLTVQALAPGEATISPAYIDAVDPARGRPMRFSSNAIAVRVTGGDPMPGLLDSIADKARRLFIAVAIVACLFAAAFVVYTLFVRRKRRPTLTAQPLTVAPTVRVVSATSSADVIGAALDGYRNERSVTALLRLRAVLFGLAGVSAGATLVDALQALSNGDADLRAALIAAEAAAFGPAADRAAAGETLLTAGDAYRRSAAADPGARTR